MWGAIASAAGSLLGGYMDRQEARHSAKQQYVYNSWLQGQNEAFQKEMAQNAHQYEIQDLEKAGLNPILSAQGSSAGSIAGSSAPQGTSAGNTGNYFGDKMEQIARIAQTKSGEELNESQAKLADSTANKTDIEAGLLPKKTQAEIKNLDKSSAKMEAEARKNKAEISLIDTQKDLNTALTQYNRERSRGKTKAYSGGGWGINAGYTTIE